MTNTLSAQVLIGGTDYTSYVTAIERQATLETPGVTATLVLKPTFPFASINPWDALEIHEQGTKTLTGYVTHIVVSRAPTQVQLQGMDTFKRARDWFLDDKLATSGSSFATVGYYATYLCNLCGLSFSINDSQGAAIILAADIPLGLRSVAEALTTLSEVAQWNMRVDPSGVLQFDHIPHPHTFQYNLGEPISFERDVNDLDTRNQVKIWGFTTSGSNGGGAILYRQDRAVTGITGTRTMVFADPHIDTVAKATQLAIAALDQWARLDDVLSAEIVGNPSLQVGQAVQVTDTLLANGLYMDTLTDLRATLDENGYKQELTVGRRAYRYPYWPLQQPPPIEWEATSVYGEALDCCVYGDSVYSAGYAFRNNSLSGRQVWRIERRLLSDGTLVWGRSIDHVVSFPNLQQKTGMWIFGISVTLDGVFVTGDADTDGLYGTAYQFVECYHQSDGHTLWSTNLNPPFGAGQDVAAGTGQLFVLSIGAAIQSVFNGIPYTLHEGPALWSLSLAGGVPGSHYAPTTKTTFQGVVVESYLTQLRRLYLDNGGSVLTCGGYQFPYFKQVYPGLQPPDPYLYRSSTWYGKISLGGVGYEVRGPTSPGDIANSGAWLDTAIDLSADVDYIQGTDYFFNFTGGLTRNGSWKARIGNTDPYTHLEIGKYVYVARGWPGMTAAPALQYYNTANGAFVGSRTTSGLTGLHGVQLVPSTDQAAVCGRKNNLFWTALWDQPV